MLVELDKRSKQQKSNDNRSNEYIICGNKTLKDTKLSKNFPFCVQQNLIWIQFSPKYQIFDKPDDLFAADIMSHKQCMNR